MNRHIRWMGLIVVVAMGFVGGCASHASNGSHPIIDVRQTLSTLAADDMEGRGVDTRGIDRAADYIAGAFKRIGLQPVPGHLDYFHRFDIHWSTEIDPQTNLQAGDLSCKLHQDFVPVTSSADGAFAGQVTFVGYGITSAAHGYDDYGGTDVKGKVVLVMRYEPHNAEGKSRFEPGNKLFSPAAGIGGKVRTAAAKGAVAVLLVTPTTFHGDEHRLLRFSKGGMEDTYELPVVHIKQSVAEHLLDRAGAPDLKALQHSIDSTGKPASVDLKDVKVKGEVALNVTTRDAKNVMAMLPGQGPNAGEYVIVGAHYDHLGYGMRIFGHAPTTNPTQPSTRPRAIFNGADDNASGTTAMLAIAERLARGPKPARSVLFVAFTGEEMGLIGSSRFVKEPPVPLERVVAMLNLDMVGRLKKDQKLLVGGGATAASFKRMLKTADDHSPLMLQSIGGSGIGPSDHTSFALKKIPVLFFFTGVHPDYHRPTDDADKINYAGLDEIIDLSTDVVRQMTTMPKEAYVSAADKDVVKIPGDRQSTTSVQLGVLPDYNIDMSTGGVKIAGATPGTSAEEAGLQADDRIIGFGDRPIDSLMDLSDALAAAKPGDKMLLKVVRDGRQIELPATLRAKP